MPENVFSNLSYRDRFTKTLLAYPELYDWKGRTKVILYLQTQVLIDLYKPCPYIP